MDKSPTIFISAGEASGEQYGALLIEALRAQLHAAGRTATFFGMGGPRMASAGLERVVQAEDMAVMGITEVVLHLPRIYNGYHALRQSLRKRRPAVAVLIDFPDIHFKLAAECKRLGIPVIFFVSPQLWAWKKHRIKLVQKFVDKMLVIFPFEEPFYREQGIQAEFVGHPLADLPAPAISREDFAHGCGLNPDGRWIALLPGSRAKEIHANLPEMLKAAHILSPRGKFEFIVPLAPTLNDAQRAMTSHIIKQFGAGLPVFTASDARAALQFARVSIVASGTATVEAALIGNPFVVVYRVSPLTYAIAKKVVKVPHVAMANLIAGKRAVPELIQSDFTAQNIVRNVGPLLPDGEARESMMQELLRIRRLLTANQRYRDPDQSTAIGRVAHIVLEQIGVRTGEPALSV
ncbi:MAG: lipid-A-disaccharide synthase [Acidobacteriota bacterium]|nr:lipid-A-disaccharide synthase [Acidobacteriota bacterium]